MTDLTDLFGDVMIFTSWEIFLRYLVIEEVECKSSI